MVKKVMYLLEEDADKAGHDRVTRPAPRWMRKRIRRTAEELVGAPLSLNPILNPNKAGKAALVEAVVEKGLLREVSEALARGDVVLFEVLPSETLRFRGVHENPKPVPAEVPEAA